jgi:hypothetical protein
MDLGQVVDFRLSSTQNAERQFGLGVRTIGVICLTEVSKPSVNQASRDCQGLLFGSARLNPAARAGVRESCADSRAGVWDFNLNRSSLEPSLGFASAR